MARAIDADELIKHIKDLPTWRADAGGNYGPPVKYPDGLFYPEDIITSIENAPTLTLPNEWVSVKIPPTEQGWYHVAILDLKTGEYKVEQDLYSIELAKIHGFEPGFCKARRWEERERIDYWCRFPSPPDRRPPEGEEDI